MARYSRQFGHDPVVTLMRSGLLTRLVDVVEERSRIEVLTVSRRGELVELQKYYELMITRAEGPRGSMLMFAFAVASLGSDGQAKGADEAGWLVSNEGLAG